VVQATADQARLSLGVMGDDAAKAALQKQIDEWQKTAARYRSEPETGEGFGTIIRTRQARRARARPWQTAKYHHFELASAAFQIGIVLASATIITGIIALGLDSGAAGCRRHRHYSARDIRAATRLHLAL